MNGSRILWLLALFALLQIHSPAAAAEAKLRILTTYLPGYSFAANLAGEYAHVENLVESGASLHDYQLSPADLRKISGADLIVINGLGIESFLDRAIQHTGPSTKDKVVVLSAGLHDQLIHQEHHHGGGKEQAHDHQAHDPHIWLDPDLAAHSVTNLLAALRKADPAHSTAYEKNAADYLQKINAMDADIRRMLEPVKKVPFITYHNAFDYFVRHYGLQLAGVVEEVPEIPPSGSELRKLHQTIRAEKVKALFAEPGTSSRLARQIATDGGINLGVLDPLETGELKSDAYEAGMRRNAKALVESLR